MVSGITGPLTIDMLGQLLRLLALVGGLLFSLLASGTMNRRLPSEYVGTLMLAVTGVMLASRANDLVMLFVALELVSIPSYVLLFIGREGRAAAESTAKYFFLSILSSALMLYGFSFLYGAAGSTALIGAKSIQSNLAGQSSALLPMAVALILAGLGFKIAAAPFHFYAPDVYQGASNVVAALLAVAPKIAGIAALIRIGSALPASDFHWKLVIVVSLLTMTVGNVGALWQTNMRRLLAYSSIAHAGYMLIGLAVLFAAGRGNPSYGGASAIVFYLATYLFASLGAFSILVMLGDEQQEVNGVDELAGLGKKRPATAAAMAAMMFSLAGIPPLAGFWGKLTLLTSSVSLSLSSSSGEVRGWFIALAIGGAANAAIAAAYYLRVIGVIYFRAPTSQSLAARGGAGAMASVIACAALVLLLGVVPGLLLKPAAQSDPLLTQTPQSLISPRPSDSSATHRSSRAELP